VAQTKFKEQEFMYLAMNVHNTHYCMWGWTWPRCS